MKHYKNISWDNIPVDKLIEIIPMTTKTYVDPLQLDVQKQVADLLGVDLSACQMYRIMLVYIPPLRRLDIHSDKPIETTEPGKVDQAVFVPIENCDGLVWRWYECTDSSKVYTVGSKSWKTVPMLPFDFAKVIETTNCDRSFIADIGTWHNLVNTSSKPAIGLSIRLMPWAWENFSECNTLPPIAGIHFA